MMKSHAMREKCCYMVLHGGRPDPVAVVDALEDESVSDEEFNRMRHAALAKAKGETQ